MRRGVLLLGLLMWLAGPCLAQEPEKVRFESVDGVQLHGRFWKGRGRTPNVVLLLHELGKDSRAQVYGDLAAALQKKDFAVLAFDFRGHGLSTEVDSDLFWSPQFPNRSMMRKAAAPEIEFRHFDKRYYPAFVNDIAAAKSFLDRKNDAQECNSANLCVIGAGTGATLAALWLNAECHRFRFFPGTLLGMPPTVANDAEGDGLLCGIFLDINPTLGGRSLPLATLLDTPGRVRKLPLIFLHGDDNDASARLAKSVVKSLTHKQKLPLTAGVAVPDAGQLDGSGLLQPGLGTHKAVSDYLDHVVEERGQIWQERDARSALYVWRVPRLGYRQTPANAKGERNLFFNSYEGFIPPR